MIVYLASQNSVPAEIAGRAVWYFLNSVTRFLIIITLASNGLSTLTLAIKFN